MKCLLLLISYFLITLTSVQSLVHYLKMEAGANGCKHEGGEIEVGALQKNPNVCGVYVCQSKEGDALIHYCQRPATFADCPRGETGVSTVIDFPQCCWICVDWKDCDHHDTTQSPESTGKEGSTDATTSTAAAF